MPPWVPSPIWSGEDAFVIGGGRSLERFDWQLLVPEKTIGCNDAYRLGPDVCKLCIFGDEPWWEANCQGLAEYAKSRPVVTNRPSMYRNPTPWLKTMQREAKGLTTEGDVLGWNGNTGAAAINLALRLGARRVFLLGFDMHADGSRGNWHEHQINPNGCTATIYRTFCRAFKSLVIDWHRKFGDRQLFNITNCSNLSPDDVPWLEPATFWAERRRERGDKNDS